MTRLSFPDLRGQTLKQESPFVSTDCWWGGPHEGLRLNKIQAQNGR